MSTTALTGQDYFFVKIGELCVHRGPAVMRTILGSCVAVILYDENNLVGGMVHVALIEGRAEEMEAEPGRFVVTGIPGLLNRMLKAGARKSGLRAAVIVGGNYTTTCRRCTENGMDIGGHNLQATFNTLRELGIPYVEKNTGYEGATRVTFSLIDGSVEVGLIPTRKACAACYLPTGTEIG